jgi:hypothetical protein
MGQTYSAARRDRRLNRYTDVLPYDANRVVLGGGGEDGGPGEATGCVCVCVGGGGGGGEGRGGEGSRCWSRP